MGQPGAKVKYALDECRTMMLGMQVLLGFQFRAFFEKRFAAQTALYHFASAAVLVLLALALALMIAPTGYHEIAARGENTRGTHSYATKLSGAGLLPFALALGLQVSLAAGIPFGPAPAAIAGVVFAASALLFWYAPAAAGPHTGAAKPDEELPEKMPTSLDEKITNVLTEARLVLPGAQALLGFQFAITLMESFDSLPASSKAVHMAGLGAIALSTVLLIAPAAYHRIVERGEETERLHRFASRMILSAMAALALGVAAESFVVVRRITGSAAGGTAAGLSALALFYGLWFGYPLWRRRREARGRLLP